MLPAVIKTCPSADNEFEALSEYQAQTPETFFEGKPVLYFHDEHVKAWCSEGDRSRLQFYAVEGSKHPTAPEAVALENDGGQHLVEEEVEVLVTSSKLIMFAHGTGTGLEIPYPAITLHAIKNFKPREQPENEALKFFGVYMQLEFSGDGNAEDDEMFDPIELTLIPARSGESDTIDPLNGERAKALFNQISACSNLHPDPHAEDDDEDDLDITDRIIFEGEPLEGLPGAFAGDSNGGLPPPMPGSSGWITADNVHEYFDDSGNWIGQLGEGAGRVRGRDEVDEEEANGHEPEDNADQKRPRTE